MNVAHLPVSVARRKMPAMKPVPRVVTTQFVPDVTDKPLFHLTPMGAIKMFLSQMLIASAATLTENQEWRLFGGLLAGGVLGGTAGMLLAALTSQRVPWQVYAARFTANVLGTLGLGAAALYFCINTIGMRAGPLLTVGTGAVFGLIGVGAFVKTLEGPLLRRLAKLAGGDDDRMPESDRIIVSHNGMPGSGKTK